MDRPLFTSISELRTRPNASDVSSTTAQLNTMLNCLSFAASVVVCLFYDEKALFCFKWLKNSHCTYFYKDKNWNVLKRFHSFVMIYFVKRL